MARVFSAGGQRVDWLDKLQGTENDEKVGLGAISDDDLRKLAQFGPPMEEVEVDVEDAEVAPEGELPVPEDTEVPISDEAEDDEVEEEVEEAGDLSTAGDAIADAQEALDEAAAIVEEQVAEESGEIVEEVAEIPVSEEESGGLTIEEPEDVEVLEVEIEEAEEPDQTAIASGDVTFVKIAKISPENRKKLKAFWRDALNYDADYVELMTKDYEK